MRSNRNNHDLPASAKGDNCKISFHMKNNKLNVLRQTKRVSEENNAKDFYIPTNNDAFIRTGSLAVIADCYT